MKEQIADEDQNASSLPSQRARMTYEEFLATDDESHSEWVNGEVIRMPSPSYEHQDLVMFLGALLRLFVEAHHLGVVYPAPFQTKLGPGLSGREPDVLFIAVERLPKLKRNYLDGPADLAVEILGPESQARDRGEKYYEYEQAGVREYWLIDPIRKQAEFHQLGSDGIYHLAALDPEGKFHSAVLKGLWLKPAWLSQEPLPPIMTVLKEWRLV